jgi:hypothetical protein
MHFYFFLFKETQPDQISQRKLQFSRPAQTKKKEKLGQFSAQREALDKSQRALWHRVRSCLLKGFKEARPNFASQPDQTKKNKVNLHKGVN